MLKCKECEMEFEDYEVLTGRDGDAYDKETRFWDICPHCLSTEIEEIDIDEMLEMEFEELSEKF